MVILIVLFFTLFVTEAISSGYKSPKEAFIAFVQTIQTGDVEKSFDLDYSQQRRTSGKFKHEITDMKTQYSTYFDENPSICPSTYGSVPCDGSRRRNIVSDIRLFIPKTSKYKVSEIVYANEEKTSARILVQVEYSTEYHPIYVDDLKAVQVYKGGITPITPAFSGYGILTMDNALLSTRECGSNYKFPFKFSRKDIKEAVLEIRAEKVDSSWLISNFDFFKNKLSLSSHYIDTVSNSTNPFEITKVLGTWYHKVPWNDGTEKTLILKASKNSDGKIVFGFLQQYYSYKPIFSKYSLKDDQIKIFFKMVLYADETDISNYKIEYLLRENGDVLTGQLFQSWKAPVNVTLKRQN